MIIYIFPNEDLLLEDVQESDSLCFLYIQVVSFIFQILVLIYIV